MAVAAAATNTHVATLTPLLPRSSAATWQWPKPGWSVVADDQKKGRARERTQTTPKINGRSSRGVETGQVLPWLIGGRPLSKSTPPGLPSSRPSSQQRVPASWPLAAGRLVDYCSYFQRYLSILYSRPQRRMYTFSAPPARCAQPRVRASPAWMFAHTRTRSDPSGFSLVSAPA